MTLLEFAQKKGFLVNGLLTITIKELETHFKKNERNKKRYFILRDKQKKGVMLSPKEDLDLRFNLKDIVW